MKLAALNHMTSTSIGRTWIGKKKKLIINFSISSFFHHHSLYPILDKKNEKRTKKTGRDLKR